MHIFILLIFKGELEDSFQRLQVENAKLEAELKHEKQRAEMLHNDLQYSQKVSMVTCISFL